MSNGKKPPKRPFAMHEDRGKQPRSSLSPDQERKQPRTGFRANPRSLAPVWSFRLIDLGASWSWTALDAAQTAALLQRLGTLESMTWEQIDGPTGSHHVEVGKLIRDARKRLVEIEQDELDVLFSLRVSGAFRLWGILREHVLHILWCDPQHQVCPSLKKGT